MLLHGSSFLISKLVICMHFFTLCSFETNQMKTQKVKIREESELSVMHCRAVSVWGQTGYVCLLLIT